MGRRAAVLRLRIVARRPTSWLALVVVAFAAWRLTAGCAGPAAAILCGASGAAVALGGLPRDGRTGAWAAARAAWPGAGAVIGWLACGCAPAAAGVVATLLVTGGATTALVAAATRVGAAPAAAMGVGLAPALAAAACAAAAPAWSTDAWAVATAGWGVAAAIVAPLHRVPTLAGTLAAGRPGDVVPRGVMLSALVAMVVFLFLAPHLAWGYAAVAAGWLLVVAAPRATLGSGPDGAVGRRMLLATAGRPAGPGRAAARLVAAYAAVLVWPPLVAALLAGAPGAAVEPLTIAAAIAAGAVTIAATAAAVLAIGGSRDTALAAVLSVVVALVAASTTTLPGAVQRGRDGAGLMLSNPGDPATLPGPREEPRRSPSPRGVASCPAPPSSVSKRPAVRRRRSCSC